MKVSSVYEGFIMRHDKQVSLLKEFFAKYYPLFNCYLLGVTESTQRTESLFTATAVTRSHLSHYYILVVAVKAPGRSLAAIEDQVESGCKGQFNITAMAVFEEQYTRWLQEHHPFITAVAQRGTLLAEAMPIQTTTTGIVTMPHEETQQVYETGLQMMTEFFEGAKLTAIATNFH